MGTINVSTDQHASRHAPGGADPINMGLIQDGAVAGFVNTPGSATAGALNAGYVPQWKANTAYVAGQAVVNPSGDLVTAKANFTSGTTYNAANWNLSASYDRKGSLVINATDPAYGAVADWTGGTSGTDNTAAINAAITAADTLGIPCYIPAGRYRVAGNIVLGKKSKFIGAGWTAIAQENYADALWTTSPSAGRYGGTVLYCSTTTGNAITGDDAVGARWVLADFMLIGPGSGTSVGISLAATPSFNIRPNVTNVGVFNFSKPWVIGTTNEGMFDSMVAYACQTGFNFGPNFNANTVTNIECQRSTVEGIILSGYGNNFVSGIVQNSSGTTGLHVATGSPGNNFDAWYFENSSATDPMLFESQTKITFKAASNFTGVRATVGGCVFESCYAPSTVLTLGTNLAKTILSNCTFSSVTRNGSDVLDLGSRLSGSSSPLVGIGNDTPWQFERTDAQSSLRLKDTVNSHYIADFYPATTDAGALAYFRSVLGSGASATGGRPNAGNFFAGGRWFDTTTKKPIWTDGAAWRDARGYITALQTKAANYTHVDGDEIVVYNGTGLTATLPDPTTVTLGKRWTVLNINTSPLTVVSAGTSKTINGAASQTLSQWARAEYASDGTQWLAISDGSPMGSVLSFPETAVSATTSLTSAALGTSVACTVTTAFTLTLPTPVGVAGQQIAVRVASSSTKLLTLATAAGNIDGLSTRIMWAGESATLLSDGTNWVKIAGKTIPMRCALTMTAAQTLPSGTVTTATLDTTALDNTGLMATLASNGITIQRPGAYTVLARAAMDQPATQCTRFIAEAQKNGTTVVVQQETSPAVGAFPTFTASDQVTFAVSDLVKLQAYQACTTAATRNFTTGSVPGATALTVAEIPSW